MNCVFAARRLCEPRAHRNRAGADHHDGFDLRANLARVGVEMHQHLPGDAALQRGECQKDVFGVDVFMLKPQRLAVSQQHRMASTTRKRLVHGCRQPFTAVNWGTSPPPVYRLAIHGSMRNGLLAGFQCSGSRSSSNVSRPPALKSCYNKISIGGAYAAARSLSFTLG